LPKLQSIEVCALAVPLDKVTSFSNRTVTARHYGLVKVRSADGVEGLGFCYVGSAAGKLFHVAVEEHPIIAAMKAAIAWKSADEQWATVRPPLVALDSAQRAQLEADLAAEGFTIPKAETLAGSDASCATAAA
jgi:L-alanine-DL-glutamate epimerase-like enolase superfamily enzyme